MADSIISVIFLIILSFISIFELRTYMQYVFEKSLPETVTTIEKHAVFSEILYVYPWKYIKRYRFVFLLFQIMYFSCIVSTILVVKTILLNYLKNRDFWKAMRYNNIAISALPMMICILVAPIIYFILRQCWGKGRVEIDTKRIEKFYHQYMHKKALLQQQNLNSILPKRKIQQMLYDMTATLVYIIGQMDPETYSLHSTREALDKRLQCIVFVIKEFEYIEVQSDYKRI